MAIFRWGHDWNPLQDFEREVDRLLHSVNLTIQNARVRRHFPPLNLYELDDEFLLTAELPGTKAQDLDLTVANGMLTLRGNRQQPDGVPEDRYRRQERMMGQWERSIPLPEKVSQEQLTARFKDGILKIHLPKSQETPPKRITVTEG